MESKNILESELLQLECHFTWELKENDLDYLENRLLDEIKFGYSKYKIGFYNHLAYVKFLQQDTEGALKFLEQAEKTARDNHAEDFEKLIIVTYGNFAWLYFHMGDGPKAQSYLRKVEVICKMFPNRARLTALIPTLYGEKGWCFLKAWNKKYEEINACFEKALEQEPDEPEWNTGYAIALSRSERGITRQNTDEETAAVNQLRRALQLDPENSMIMALLALVLKQKTESTELAEQALKMSHDNPLVAQLVGKVFRLLGEADKSLQILQAALPFTSSTSILHYQIALNYKSKVRDANCLTKNKSEYPQIKKLIEMEIYHLKQVAQQRPSYIWPQVDLATCYADLKNFGKALKIMSSLFSIPDLQDEEKQEIHLNLGKLYFYRLKSVHVAVAHFKAGIQIETDSEKRKQCFSSLRKVAETLGRGNPENGLHFALHGFIHQMNNSKTEAIQFYEKALFYDKGNEEYLKALSDLHHPVS
ncbi:interferon-induced protein with tetratricopeptide repeats 1-like [Erpetoichthys calabaricus]|uniref:Interferon-induced protein with tetratricopeptide repeats 1-like n=1 Tax=Erpetoichthys calabaricus TaxID=27687 RepID=A0A8C4RMT4_ERPCA|nr:interferon-induced protein with tetratricopeptide repeats 1-like [Erpetoichthys calabaricus]